MKWKDLTGQRFGKLTAIRRLEPQRGRTVKWICKCDCGNETVVQRSNLDGGSTTSCGQHSYQDLCGQKFGRLICLRKGQGRQHRNGIKITWICKCDCGSETEIVASQLTSGQTRSCGCLRRETTHKNYFKGYEDISGKYWSTVRGGAKKRKLEFNITMKDVWKQFLHQKRKCALSGLNIFFSLQTSKGTASIDRIDNTKGYIKSNIQIVHKRINIMKNNLTQKDFVAFCQQVVYTTK